MKKEYVKPQMAVVNVMEGCAMICSSTEYVGFSDEPATELD